ncbi:uroporphyrin-3 C-methyltransferase [Vibrio xiamenensis]|uniref:Uroporphyrin-3 C-methyltransferase n=1 Tax=Vibrio xiamenensis TaxID=861298 RepID=A0A1G8G1I6_9VIBR|nr:uroporphyrinogen-III C-methyltransferase [Vibrio xiamenensis]SDH88259.1 uroporphyrin-3 C-methyltransferase [Vibrio xiamenensis]
MTDKNNNDSEQTKKPTNTPVVVEPSDTKASVNDKKGQPEAAKEKQQGSSDNKNSTTAKTATNHHAPAPKAKGGKMAALALLISIVFAGGVTYYGMQKDAQYQARIAALESQLSLIKNDVNTKVDDAKQQAISKATEVTNRVETVLEQQQKSIKSLQIAVADVKGRRPNDWLLAEADYLVKLAGRKLFLEHDAFSATKLMQSADVRIAALNDPSLVPLRQAMANDITKLKNVPLIDRDGLVLRLVSLQQQVDALPLANAILPDAPQVNDEKVSEEISDWQTNLMTSLKDFSENFITFRTRDGNVIPLLSPKQDFYLRENLKAQLQTAIKGVYDEQQDIYNIALKTAKQWSTNYLNQDDTKVAEFNKTLSLLQKAKISVEYPVKLETQKQLSDVINERLRREVTTLTTEEK